MCLKNSISTTGTFPGDWEPFKNASPPQGPGSKLSSRDIILLPIKSLLGLHTFLISDFSQRFISASIFKDLQLWTSFVHCASTHRLEVTEESMWDTDNSRYCTVANKNSCRFFCWWTNSPHLPGNAGNSGLKEPSWSLKSSSWDYKFLVIVVVGV